MELHEWDPWRAGVRRKKIENCKYRWIRKGMVKVGLLYFWWQIAIRSTCLLGKTSHYVKVIACCLSVSYSGVSAEENNNNKKETNYIFNGEKISKIHFPTLFTDWKQKCDLFREVCMMFLAWYLFWKVWITLFKQPLEKSCSALNFQSQSNNNEVIL